jgi:hypothetical protein
MPTPTQTAPPLPPLPPLPVKASHGMRLTSHIAAASYGPVLAFEDKPAGAPTARPTARGKGEGGGLALASSSKENAPNVRAPSPGPGPTTVKKGGVVYKEVSSRYSSSPAKNHGRAL